MPRVCPKWAPNQASQRGLPVWSAVTSLATPPRRSNQAAWLGLGGRPQWRSTPAPIPLPVSGLDRAGLGAVLALPLVGQRDSAADRGLMALAPCCPTLRRPIAREGARSARWVAAPGAAERAVERPHWSGTLGGQTRAKVPLFRLFLECQVPTRALTLQGSPGTIPGARNLQRNSPYLGTQHLAVKRLGTWTSGPSAREGWAFETVKSGFH